MFKVGVDLGYGYTKIAAENSNRICFPSLVTKGQEIDMPDLLGAREDYIATINGTTWYVGKMAAKENRLATRAFDANERFNNGTFQTILATALAVSIPNGEDIMVVTGLPLSAFKDSQNSFLEFLKQYSATVIIEGKEKNISVKAAHVFPQAAGIFVNPYCSHLKDALNPGDLVTVIDIGYRTTDVAVFEYTGSKYLFLADNSFTIDTGMSTIFRSLGDIVASDAGAFEVRLEVAEAIFSNGVGYINNKPMDYRDKIAELKATVVNRIMDGYNLKGPKMEGQKGRNVPILAGGGSIPLNKELLSAFPEAETIQDAQFANAVGFLEVGKRLDISILD
ncbi:ParM/StbA family protein [Bacteroides sp.]|uniref:ParM/StbA family protein n=1 Tax=Bacteroides sp. TaxID=29523 RepID=UPI00262F54A4|nr:ParM/StbA family protein [Bacteroides sp.]MDD3040397.1 ParM/StbA family protein [Bacteroides sp.]